MGFVKVKVAVENVLRPASQREVELLVDRGALYSMIPAAILREISVEPYQKLDFELADGTTVHRDVGEVRFRHDGRRAVSPVIFGEGNDASVLGVVTLEAMGLEVDPVRKQIRPTKLILY
jgi:predicted aspartyl protease